MNRKKIWMVLIICLPFYGKAQDCMEVYKDLMQQAKKHATAANYQKALDTYSAADIAAKDCNENKSTEINKAISSIFQEIDKKRKEAIAAKKETDKALTLVQQKESQMQKALRQAEKALLQQAEAEKGKEAAEAARQAALSQAHQRAIEAEAARKEAETARQTAETAQKEAEKERKKAEAALAKADRVLSRIYFYGANKNMALSRKGTDGKFGLIDREGNFIVDYVYDERPVYDESIGFFSAKRGGKEYRINEWGEFLYAGNLKELTQETMFLELQNLKKVPEITQDYPNVKVLILMNDLTKPQFKKEVAIPASVFNSMKHLRMLKIDGYWQVPDNIVDLLELEKLYFSTLGKRGKLADGFSKWKNLALLDLSISAFESVPVEIGNLSALKQLTLSGLYLNELPSSISKLKKLEKLTIGPSFSLLNLPSEIGELESLKELDLNFCIKLEALPESIGKLERLNKLSIMAAYDMNTLPESIGNLKSLKILDLSFCDFKSLPNTMVALKDIDYLSFPICKGIQSVLETVVNMKSLCFSDDER